LFSSFFMARGRDGGVEGFCSGLCGRRAQKKKKERKMSVAAPPPPTTAAAAAEALLSYVHRLTTTAPPLPDLEPVVDELTAEQTRAVR
jgi:hypothetical protein